MSYTNHPLSWLQSAAMIGALVLATAACGERASNETAPTGSVPDETTATDTGSAPTSTATSGPVIDLEQPETEPTTAARDQETIPDTAHQSVAEVEIVDMDWDITPLGHYITYPSPYDGGYMALMNGHVATSPDALSWEIMATQPFTTDPEPESQRMLAVTPDGPIAVSSTSGAFIFRNARWEAITIEGLPAAPIIEDGYPVYIGLIDDTATLTIGNHAYWLFDGEMFRSAPEIAEMTWSNVWNRVAYVTEIPPPPTLTADRFVYGAARWEGRVVALGWPEDDAPAWTTIDQGQTWTPVPMLGADWNGAGCGPLVPQLTPQVIEVGPLGWVAAGSWCAPPVWWYSPDGISWDQFQNQPDVAGWDIMVPFPPSILVEDNRIIIYGRTSISVMNP